MRIIQSISSTTNNKYMWVILRSRLSTWRQRRAIARLSDGSTDVPGFRLPERAVDLLCGARLSRRQSCTSPQQQRASYGQRDSRACHPAPTAIHQQAQQLQLAVASNNNHFCMVSDRIFGVRVNSLRIQVQLMGKGSLLLSPQTLQQNPNPDLNWYRTCSAAQAPRRARRPCWPACRRTA